VKERRVLNPNIAQQLWPTIVHIKKLKQIPTLEKLQAHMFKKFHITSTDCQQYVDHALADGLLVTTIDHSAKDVTVYAAPLVDPPSDGHDWYCFQCHTPGKVIECQLCWRVYHLDCTNQDHHQPFTCTLCLSLQNHTERMIGSKKLSLNELNQLLSYVYLHLIEKGNDLLKLSTNEEDDYKIQQLIYHKMDLSEMSDKIKKNGYKKLMEFEIDCKNIVHNISVLYGSNSEPKSTLAQQILQDCNHEFNLIRECVDCYRMSNQKEDKFWFCKPCNPPHQLVYAKQKGFPFWPAKVIKIENGIYDVRFFGSFHERSSIEADCVKPISLTLTQLRVFKPSPPLNKALSELKRYQKMLEEPTDNSTLDSSSTPLKSISKRPRRRADGSRPRKKLAKIKEDQVDANLELSLDSTPTRMVHNSDQRTSTPRGYVKSPMRTRNKGVRIPCKSIRTRLKSNTPKTTKTNKPSSSPRITSSTQTHQEVSLHLN